MTFLDNIALRIEADLTGATSTVGAQHGEARLDYDAWFIERLQAGDEACFERLVCERTNDIYGVLLRLTQDPEEARDLTQETFLQAFRYISNFRGESDLRTWLYRIAINQARNRSRWWRRRFRLSTVSLDSSTDDEHDALNLTLADSRAASPERTALEREREHALFAALDKLSQAHREIVILRDIEGLSYEEVASATGVSVGTVKSRLSRARAELKKRLERFFR